MMRKREKKMEGTGYIKIETEIRRGDGTVKEHLVEEGLSGTYATYVNDGLEYTVKLLNGISTDPFIYMSNGTGSTAESNAQTALVSENTGGGMDRKEATCSYEADYKAKWIATWTASGGTEIVREIGIHDDPTAGNMLMRHVYAANKTLADTESITVTAIFTQARTAL